MLFIVFFQSDDSSGIVKISLYAFCSRLSSSSVARNVLVGYWFAYLIPCVLI